MYSLLKSLFYFTLLIACAPLGLVAQQLSNGSPLSDGVDIQSNPAFTAADRITTVNAGITQRWVGFADAPTTAFASVQLALNRQPLALGLFVESDQFLPFQTQTVGLTYSYILGGFRKGTSGKRNFAGKRKHGQLSLALSTAFRQTSFDPTNIISSSPTDQRLPAGSMNVTSPVFGAGVYYLSRLAGPEDLSYGSLGLGFQQVIDLAEENSENGVFNGLAQALHGNLFLAYHHEAEGFILKPQLRIDFTANSPSSARFSILAERSARYWGGLTYDINQTIGLQTGYIISPANNDQQLRIGVLGSFNLGSGVGDRGLGYAGYLAYRFGS